MSGWMLVIVALLLVFSQKSMDAAYGAAQVFMRSVMPALFPMMVISNLMAAKKRLFHSRTLAKAFQVTFGFCSGSPAAAKQLMVLDALYGLHNREFFSLFCMSAVMSPLFFTGMLGSIVGMRTAWQILLCHWASALLTGGLWVVWHGVHPGCTSVNKQNKITRTAVCEESPSDKEKQPCVVLLLPKAISEAAHSLLSVLGAMMLFSILAAIMQALFGQLFPSWTADDRTLLALGWAVMEIGSGIASLLEHWPSAPPWLLCALCSFGGLSIWLQNLLFLGQKIHPAKLLLGRLLHGVVGGFVCFGFTFCFGEAAPVAAMPAAVFPIAGIPQWLPLLLLTALAVLPLRPSA